MQQFNIPFIGPEKLGAVVLAARSRFPSFFFCGLSHLGGVISAARLRLGCAVLAMVLLQTELQRGLVNGRTIELGVMIYPGRTRLGPVILALTLLHTEDQRVLTSGPTIQLGRVIVATRLRLTSRDYIADANARGNSACFFPAARRSSVILLQRPDSDSGA